jgi:hypothetical protein
MTDDDYDALSQKQLASIKRDMRISLEDAAVRATYKVMAELAQPEQPKVRTGDCLLVGVCASEGHKIQVKQEPWRESASDYERGVIDGRQMQAQSSVDKAVNRMAQPEQEPVATLDDLEQEIYENTRQFVSRDVMEWMLKRYYTTPPQRTWVGLTDEEIKEGESKEELGHGFIQGVLWAEAKLKEKNG